MENLEEIEGEVLQTIYKSNDNKFAVIKVRDYDHSNIFTAVGDIHGPKTGAIIKLSGYWVNDRKHGVQFKTLSSKVAVPDTFGGLIRYLGSNFVDAVGPKSARKIVEFFGEGTIDILENDIEKLLLVPGIGQGRLRNIKLAWNDQKLFNVAIRGKLKKESY